ncbi:unnamed protein product [Urochloa humidicola]
MNPETKIILDELSKRFDSFESKWGSRFSEVEEKFENRLKESEEQIETRLTRCDEGWERRFADLQISHDARVTSLERAAASLEEWRPDIEGTMDDIRLEVNKISKNWE